MKHRTLVVLAVVSSLAACDEKKPGPAAASSAPASQGSAPPLASAPPPPTSAPSPSASAAPKAAPTAVAAQHVLVAYRGAKGAPAGVKRTKTEAKARAEEVVSKAKAGEDFASLVATYSDDPGSKARMGSVGKFTRDKMVAPFSDAAFALDVDAVSGVVETPFGFHVIKRNQ